MKKAKTKAKRSALPKAAKPASKKQAAPKPNPAVPEPKAKPAAMNGPRYPERTLAPPKPNPDAPDVTVRTIYHDDQHLPALCFRPKTGLYAHAVIGDRVDGIRTLKISIRDHDRAELTQHGHGTLRGAYPPALFARHMHTLAHNGATVTAEARELLAPLVPSPLPSIAPPASPPVSAANAAAAIAADVRSRVAKAPAGPSRTSGKELIRELATESGLPPEKVRAKLRGAGLRAPYTDADACRKALGVKSK